MTGLADIGPLAKILFFWINALGLGILTRMTPSPPGWGGVIDLRGPRSGPSLRVYTGSDPVII